MTAYPEIEDALQVVDQRTAWTLMFLMLWINGYRHDFSTDEAFNLVVNVAAGDVSLEDSAGTIAAHLVRRYPCVAWRSEVLRM